MSFAVDINPGEPLRPFTRGGSDRRFPSDAAGVGQSFVTATTASGRFRLPCSSRPFATSGDGIVRRGSPSRAVGVGHCLTATSVKDTCDVPLEPERSESFAVAVGHIFDCTVSDVGELRGPPGNLDFIARCASGDFWSSFATGVAHAPSGHDPEAFPLVRGSNAGRGEQTPFRIEPESGKIRKDVLQTSSFPVGSVEVGHVLHEDVARSHLADDSSDFGPEPPVVVNSTSPACSGPRLAREPGSDEIHDASKRAAVEGRNVRPDRSAIQPRFFHACHENGRCVAVPLNVSHGSGHSSEGNLESGVAAAQVQGPQQRQGR